MKLALINAHAATNQLRPYALWLTGHDVVTIYGVAPPEIADSNTRILALDVWEALLHETQVDAVLVVEPGQITDELVRIVQAGLPMIVMHPVAPMLDCFSMQMAQRDSGSMIFPLVTFEDAAAIMELQRWLSSPEQSPIGPIEQMTMERPMGDRTRGQVERQFGQDAYVLRRICTSITHLSAVGAESNGEDWARLRVQMVTRNGVSVSWTSRSDALHSPATLTLFGDRGSACIKLHGCPQRWEFEQPFHPSCDSSISIATNVFDRVATAIEADEHRIDLWDDACRAMELADTIEYSLRRGKTVELFETEVTEAGTFRSMMAAGGCLMLMATLCLVLLLAAVESVWSIGGWFRYVPWGLLVLVLGVFLGLQLFSLALPRSGTDRSVQRDA